MLPFCTHKCDATAIAAQFLWDGGVKYHGFVVNLSLKAKRDDYGEEAATAMPARHAEF